MLTMEGGQFDHRKIVVNDLTEALLRIKEIDFQAGKVVIRLINSHPGVKTTVEALDIMLVTKEGLSMPSQMIHNIAYFDEESSSLVIEIPRVTKVIIFDGGESQIFKKSATN